jgi:Tfp pilus assembly protein PilF
MRVETFIVLGLLTCGAAVAGEADCGSLENSYGPYDYTNPVHRAENIPIVETAHLNADVRALRRGQTGTDPLGDLDYTLRAVPNHPAALDAVARYFINGGSAGRYWTAECYFDRAMRFKPDDGTVYLVYGVYLHRKKEFADAERQYLRALELLGESADAHYNIGLLYVDMDDLEKAKQHALKAYQLGYPLPGLKKRLREHGMWSAADDQAIAAAIAGPPGP